MRQLVTDQRLVFVEDESQLIGRVALPDNLRAAMASAPMALVEESLESRVQVVLEDYIVDMGQTYLQAFGEQGPQNHRDKLVADLGKVQRRLGGARYQEINQLLQAAFERQWQSGDLDLHRQWITAMLRDYYDPMYRFQLEKRQGEILMQGSRSDIIAWARDYAGGVEPTDINLGGKC